MYTDKISSHLQDLLIPGKIQDKGQDVLDKLKEVDKNIGFDAIAVCGCSGLILAGYLSIHLGKNIIVVRKVGEERYSKLQVEGPMDGRYVIVDDLICTGRTTKYIKKAIKKYLCEYSVCVGILLWAECLDNNRGLIFIPEGG